ncbi:MAG: hypothetical protein NTY08_10700 [Proteobacteria bacterium]|nr:hypothetical protein [Pseudomonadota bacterium]
MVLTGNDVFVHDRSADFSVGPYTFEIGGPNKKKKQIRSEKQTFVVKDEWGLSADPSVVPLWVFGMLGPS